MSEFFNVLPPEAARELLKSYLRPISRFDEVKTSLAWGRVLAQDVFAPHALPAFRRSTMDGFAVRASDTYGASPTLPAMLQVAGEIKMGEAAKIQLEAGQAALIHTGGMIPDTANAVVQIEHTQAVDELAITDGTYDIEILNPVAPGQNVIQIGEDVFEGEIVLSAGKHIRPQDVGALLSLGFESIKVIKRPVIGIMSTGDELVEPGDHVQPGQIRDINSYTISALCQKAGADYLLVGIVPDDYEALLASSASTLSVCDMLVISAGSSVSVRDMTVDVLGKLGEPGILAHGVATKPGKPTIIGAANGKPLLGLPGNPVSAIVQFLMFGVPAIYNLQGRADPPLTGSIWAELNQNVASETGREDYVPVQLEKSASGLQVRPIFGKSNLIFSLVKADGLMKIPLNQGGVLAGELVEVILF